MAKVTWIKVSGVWKEVIRVWRRTGGTWSSGVIPWIKVSGTWKDAYEPPKIETDKVALSIPWQSGEYSDYCIINVTPNTITTTITKVDTGDGTGWVGNPLPTGDTGDYNFRFRATSDNGAFPRSFTARISDNAGVATSVDVTVTQQPQPV